MCEAFGVPGMVDIREGKGGMPMIVLRHPSGARVEAYLQGAHVTSWRTADGVERLFVSEAAHFSPGKPIRGGIPVIFPQFGAGPMPQHAFARVSEFQPRCAYACGEGVCAVLRLESTPQTLEMWPHPFIFKVILRLEADSLTIKMKIKNPGEAPFTAHAALHTYFAVNDIQRAAVRGLRGTTYIDSRNNDARFTEQREELRVTEEVDRIYVDAPDTLHLIDEAAGTGLQIEKKNLPDVVVWNPWIEKSRRMADFGDEEYPQMLCVETGIIAAQRQIEPGEKVVGETVFMKKT